METAKDINKQRYFITMYGSRSNDNEIMNINNRLTNLGYNVFYPKLDASEFTDDISIKGLMYSSTAMIDKSDACIFMCDDMGDKSLLQLGYAAGNPRPIVIGIGNDCSMAIKSMCTYYIDINNGDTMQKLIDYLDFNISIMTY